jgi:UDP-glucose 4-epimerase
MRVLVTGSAGRVGRAVYARLLREHEVVGFDRTPASTVDFTGDLGEPFLLRRALRDVDAIVHTAALHAPHVNVSSDAEFDRVNVQLTATLARMAVENGVRRFVFTSTTALYGAASRNATQAVWVDESLRPKPTTIYHRSKLAAEVTLAKIAQQSLCVTALRMSRCFPEAVPLMAAYRLHRGVDVRDVAEAHALALARDTPGLRVFNVSAQTPFVANDLEELLRDAPAVLRRRAPSLVEAFAAREWPLPRTIDRVYSPAAAIAELGWRPRFGFEEVLRLYDAECPEVLPPFATA